MHIRPLRIAGWLALVLAAGLMLGAGAFAYPLEISVVTPDGSPISGGFKWLLEVDNTLQTPPGVSVNPSISTDIHESNAPVVLSGEVQTGGTATAEVPDIYATTPLFASVMSYPGYQMSGRTVAAGGGTVKIVVNPLPIPTAQITVFVFNDNNPINNAPDALEAPLEGWEVRLDDTVGQVTRDAYGNLLGTTYVLDGDGNVMVDADGQPVGVLQEGLGYYLTDATGTAHVKYVAPGKYGVNVVPPRGEEETWIQTATIEGTSTIDAFVKANEPPVFLEGFGTGFAHVAFGFVQPKSLPWGSDNNGTPQAQGDPEPVGGWANLHGTVNYNHFAAPPVVQGFFKGAPLGEAMVGLNDANGAGLLVVPTTVNAEGQVEFAIDGIPPGTYELVTFDVPLLSLFGFNTIIVHSGTNVIGPVDPVTGLPPAPTDPFEVLAFAWFGNYSGSVFNDTNANGFPDPGEPGINNQVLNLRFRDGSIYQSTVSDPNGEFEFAEVFPFFKWLVAEVDFGRFKATGLTKVVDYGGEIPTTTPDWLADGRRTPLAYPWPDGPLYRTETGPVLTQAMQLFLAGYNRIDWGKADYGPGESGGITGVVVYATTRPEDDPRLAVQDAHEPGIPRAQVNLYLDTNGDKIIDDMDAVAGVTPADVDVYPLGWADGGAMSPGDVDHNANGTFDAGDAVQIVWSDSFDDAKPSDCNWGGRPVPVIAGSPINQCMDNFGTWNQIEDGVFDGGYAFDSYWTGGYGQGTEEPLVPGYYIVETPAPGSAYILQKEEDKNVDFGESYTPSNQAVPVECVGDLHTVPAVMSFQTFADGITLLPGVTDPVASIYAGQSRPLCDRKFVQLSAQRNAAADFHYYTMVPKATRALGFVNNDLGAEFNQDSPIYGEKPAPKWLPISFRDWAGNEITRVYTDEFGSYNALLPSNYTNSLPTPFGYGPAMYTNFLNHPFITHPDGSQTVDPFYDPNYSQMGWTAQYYPGRTSYLDTPILPLAAQVGYPDFQVDRYAPDGTPGIAMVTGPSMSGPILRVAGNTLTITSKGNTEVPNPAASSLPGNIEPKTIIRDFGFGATPGTVTIGGHALLVTAWTNASITVQAQAADFSSGLATGQLEITRGDNGLATEVGITVHVVPSGDTTPVVYVDPPTTSIETKIQDAVDAAAEGSIIMVRPGQYNEAVIVYKNLRMQGFGGDSTIVYSYPDPLDKIQAWHDKIQELISTNQMLDLGGVNAFTPFERPGFMMLPLNLANAMNNGPRRIDGFAVTGSVAGGGIQVPDLGYQMQITNNHVFGNLGTVGGGIVIGQNQGAAACTEVVISHNHVMSNSGKDGGGGGITIYTGSDDYQVVNNRIAGNFTTWDGGGIAHYGLSDGGLIQNNKIVFNEVFFGAQAGGEGGGIYVAGEGAAGGGLGDGAGSVRIISNLIQGNLAGTNAGGGIRADFFNGQDTTLPQSQWYELRIINNILANNVSAYHGGGIALKETAKVVIYHNTITGNDSTATSASAFIPGATTSTPQGAGVTAEVHSAELATNTGQTYPIPLLVNDIILNNRSFYMDTTLNNGAGELILTGYNNLAVAGTALKLNPQGCLLNSAAGYPGNVAAPTGDFVQAYVNDLLFAVVTDEGGNNITARFSPVSPLAGDYNLGSAASAAFQNGNPVAVGAYPELATDYNGALRPVNLPDIGAVQFEPAAPCTGDLNADNKVDLKDLRVFREDYGCTGVCIGDLNGDLVVNGADLTLMFDAVGNQCP